QFAVRLAKLADSDTKVAMAVRADFWADCVAHAELGKVITASSMLVGPLNEHELRIVVSEGARRAGLSADEDLVERLIADTRGQQGVLPLVSTALSRTWERREADRLTLRGYESIGGIQGAVAGLAEESYAELDADQQQAARVILVRLASESTTGRPVRRKAP